MLYYVPVVHKLCFIFIFSYVFMLCYVPKVHNLFNFLLLKIFTNKKNQKHNPCMSEALT